MAKAPNYSPEATELAVGMYLGVRDESEERRNEVVMEIADLLQKDVRSVRAKLSRERMEDGSSVYVPKVKVSKVTGEEPAKKAELAARLISVTGVDANKVDAERVAKMNKTDITAFIAAFEALTVAAEDADAESAEAEDYSETESAED